MINEIMYSPLSNQLEWIEILNLSSVTINLDKWSVSDSDTSKRVNFGRNSYLASNEFFVLAEDSSIFDFFNPPIGSVSVSKKLPSFNNDFDSVVLYDPSAIIMDRVNYNNDWGGTNNGRDLPDGTYYYVMSTPPAIDNPQNPTTSIEFYYHGSITILR